MEQGRIHEALFITKIIPSNLNIALKLLNYKESKELFRIINEDFELTKDYHQETPETKAAARADIIIEFEHPKGTQKSYPLHKLILVEATGKPLPATPMVYSGSYVHEGKYKADLAGDIIAILEDRGALFNCPIKDRNGDRLWMANLELLPPFQTPVTIKIKPHQP